MYDAPGFFVDNSISVVENGRDDLGSEGDDPVLIVEARFGAGVDDIPLGSNAKGDDGTPAVVKIEFNDGIVVAFF